MFAAVSARTTGPPPDLGDGWTPLEYLQPPPDPEQPDHQSIATGYHTVLPPAAGALSMSPRPRPDLPDPDHLPRNPHPRRPLTHTPPRTPAHTPRAQLKPPPPPAPKHPRGHFLHTHPPETTAQPQHNQDQRHHDLVSVSTFLRPEARQVSATERKRAYRLLRTEARLAAIRMEASDVAEPIRVLEDLQERRKMIITGRLDQLLTE